MKSTHAFLFALIWCVGLLAVPACRTADQSNASTGDNQVVLYLQGAERQAESPAQEREILKALEDLRTLPPETLKTQRYADYGDTPGQWTLAQLLQKYFVPEKLTTINEDAFYRDAQSPVARAVVNEHIKAIHEQRQVFKTP